MADFLIQSLRGGQCEDAPASLADDQCVLARNVEWWKSPLGERRLGSTAIDLTGSDLATCDRIVWVYRHLPTTDLGDAQLWALGITDGSPSTATLAYKDTTWHTVTMDDAIDIDGINEYQVQGQTLHGKLFIAYGSGVDRLHVWDGTSLRRTGIAEPAAAPTGADSASAGSFSGTRYYRVRFTAQGGSGVTLRRSEPSDTLTFSPDGAHTGVVVTRPSLVNEGETHWELEASVDNANFYRIATTAVATTTATDTQDFSTGYATAFTLSADIGDYDTIPSVRFLTADTDRLMGGGSFEDTSLASRVLWTPVYADPGDGNDERIPLSTDNFKDLDGFEGGPLTGLSATVNGYVYATKLSHIYQLTRTGLRANAYQDVALTKQRGALPGSLVDALDETGNPTPFALDPDIGPIHITERGVEPCGFDLILTWDTINLDATKVLARALYFKEKKQVHWWISTGTANTPNLRIVLHTTEMRQAEDGKRRGWATWDGGSASVLAVCMFADNIDAGVARSNVLKPFVGVEGNGLIWRTDTGTADNDTAYAASIKTKPYVHGSLLNRFEVKNAALLAKAATGATMDVTLTGDFGADAKSKVNAGISFTPTGSEDRVIKALDDCALAELATLQVTFADPASPGSAQWLLEGFGMREVGGQSS